MSVVDKLNARWGKATVKQGSVGTAAARRDWAMRQARRTPQYTTDWRQVPVARLVIAGSGAQMVANQEGSALFLEATQRVSDLVPSITLPNSIKGKCNCSCG